MFRIETSATAVEVHGYLQRYRALQIQSEIYNRLTKSPGSETGDAQSVHEQLSKKLGDWKDSSSQLPNKTLIESEWLMGRMLLLRPCKLLPQRTHDELGELWQAAVGFIAIYRQLVESNSIFYVQIACEKVYWTGLMAFYSYWQLRTRINPDANTMRRLDVWMIVKDVMFILRALSERWEQGKLLCGRFDAVSTRVLELSENDKGDGLPVEMPVELQNLEHYTSLTVVWASGDKMDRRDELTLDTNELRHLVSEML